MVVSMKALDHALKKIPRTYKIPFNTYVPLVTAVLL
jgi:hypothetical protein